MSSNIRRKLIVLIGGLCLPLCLPAVAQIVADGGFEAGTPNPYWEESSSNFDSPICSAQRCGDWFGGPFEGQWWAWFGGATTLEIGSLSQEVTIPDGVATLLFWLDITAAGGNGEDYLTVSLDGQEVFSVLESDMGSFHPWTEIAVDISAFADGGGHLLSFESMMTGPERSNFFVDAVEITVDEDVPGDLNGDGCVDQADLGILLASWMTDGGGDLDGDGDTDQADLGILLGHWGEGC